MDKDVRKLIRRLEAQGFEVRYSAKGYPLVYRDGEFVTKLPQTPSDWRGLKNSVAHLKRHGYRP
ncbi:hypothetical protein [Sciscionella sediminilitoris]|uniref:hypothetical protein n=1 Tax=Sciscionella sediminilitoris TaxID=1445613 RepID=UPI00068A3600|nr:hypothetical protein [Sciscionella sp. SE31]